MVRIVIALHFWGRTPEILYFSLAKEGLRECSQGLLMVCQVSHWPELNDKPPFWCKVNLNCSIAVGGLSTQPNVIPPVSFLSYARARRQQSYQLLPPGKSLFGQYETLLFPRAVIGRARNGSSVLSEGFWFSFLSIQREVWLRNCRSVNANINSIAENYPWFPRKKTISSNLVFFH